VIPVSPNNSNVAFDVSILYSFPVSYSIPTRYGWLNEVVLSVVTKTTKNPQRKPIPQAGFPMYALLPTRRFTVEPVREQFAFISLHIILYLSFISLLYLFETRNIARIYVRFFKNWQALCCSEIRQRSFRCELLPMYELAQTFGYLLILFVVSAAVSWFIFSVFRAPVQAPPANTRLLLRRGSSVLLCHVLGQRGRTWHLTTPVLRSEVVPVRPCERFLAEYETPSGVARFFTRVLSRHALAASELQIEAPSRIQVLERRSAQRVRFTPTLLAFSEGCPIGEFTNASRYGGNLRTLKPYPPEAIFELTLAGHPFSFRAIVLACQATQGQLPGYICRLRFERDLTDSEWSDITKRGQIV
jgi:hypothetical protein